MRLFDFFKEHFFFLFSYLFFVLLFFHFFWLLHVETAFLFLFLIVFCLFGFCWFFYYFWKKKQFYDSFFEILNKLDQKYLVHEMDVVPNSFETKKLMEILYEVDKSMKEQIQKIYQTNQDFRDYIELWIHEIKIPLANLVLMTHNKENDERKILKQLHRMEDYIEQVLYYVRSEMVEKDYFIQSYSLKKLVSSVVKKNKDAFIYGSVSLQMNEVTGEVLTDGKWLKFILNQIIANSLKYQKEKGAFIEIRTKQMNQQTLLIIRDNGIGIKSSELARVFDKSFTESNGRGGASSTGMGLYLCKKLILKLRHEITITSKENEFTEVTIIFSHSDFYQVL